MRYYRASGFEVDFVRNKMAWESKYRDDITEEDIKTLRNLRGYSKTVITRTKEGEINGVKLIPLWRFLFE